MGNSDSSDALIVSMGYTEAISQVVNSRIKQHRVSPSALCVIAHELACSRVLTYLAETIDFCGQSNPYNINSNNNNNNNNNNNAPSKSSPTSQSNSPVGAVIIIDPPPLLSLQADPVRASLRILQRYLDPLHAPAGRLPLYSTNQPLTVLPTTHRSHLSPTLTHTHPPPPHTQPISVVSCPPVHPLPHFNYGNVVIVSIRVRVLVCQ